MSTEQSDFEDGVITERKEKYDEPLRYKVILHNDDYTTMEFVVLILKKFFYKNETEATTIMWNVHKKGAGLAGIYTFEIAETKVKQVHFFSKSNQHPLRCSMEPE